MARIWQTGAELGSRVAEGGLAGGPGITPAAARTGTWGWRHVEPSTTIQLMYRDFTTKRTTTCFMRVYVRMATLPGGNTGLFGIMDSINNGRVAGIQITPTGALQLTNLANAQVGSNSTALTLGVWYRVELKYTATATGAIEALIDGTSFASGNNPSHSNVGWNRIYLGNSVSGSGSGIVADYDDIAVNDSSGSAQNGYPGAGGIINVHPAGTGSSNQWRWDDGTAGNANSWVLVSEVTPDDANSWLESTTLNDLDTYTVGSAPSVGSINVVAIGTRYSNDTASAVSAFKPRLQKTSGGTVAEGTAIVANSTAWTTDKDGYALVAYTDPDGAAWTASTLASMRIGMKLTADDTSKSRVTAIWASIDAIFVPTGTVGVSGVDTLTTAGRVVRRAASSSVAASALVAAAVAGRVGVAALAGQSTLAVAGVRGVAATVTLAATVALSVGAVGVEPATTSASASATLTAAGIAVRVGAAQQAGVSDVVIGGDAVREAASGLASLGDVVVIGARVQPGAVALDATSAAVAAALRVVGGSVVATGAARLDVDAVLAGTAGGAVAATATSALDSVGLVVKQGPSLSSASATITAVGIAVETASAQLAAACVLTVGVRVVHDGHVDLTSVSAITADLAGEPQAGTVALTASSGVAITATRVRGGRVNATATSSIFARTSNVIRRPTDGTIRRPGSAWRVASVVCRARGEVHVG